MGAKVGYIFVGPESPHTVITKYIPTQSGLLVELLA
jgi:hypothetical protein